MIGVGQTRRDGHRHARLHAPGDHRRRSASTRRTAGDANANASTSATDSVSVSTKSIEQSTLTVPSARLRQERRSPLTAKVTPSPATGTVDFSVDGRLLGTVTAGRTGRRRHVGADRRPRRWTVTAAVPRGRRPRRQLRHRPRDDPQPLQHRPDHGGPARSDAARGRRAARSPSPTGNAVALDVRSTSGLNVRLAIAGPCALEGNTVRVKGVGGPCTLTASTNGGNGWAPVTQRYYISTVAGSQVGEGPGTAVRRLRPRARGCTSAVGRRGHERQPAPAVEGDQGHGDDASIVASGKFYVVQLAQAGPVHRARRRARIADQWKAFGTPARTIEA